MNPVKLNLTDPKTTNCEKKKRAIEARPSGDA